MAKLIQKNIAIWFSALLVLSAAAALAADNGWLVGKWELSYDPDGSEKDWMEFTADGQTFSINQSGRRIPGVYIVTDTEVRATYTHKGVTIPLSFKYSPDKKKLLVYSAKTGNTAVYEKIK